MSNYLNKNTQSSISVGADEMDEHESEGQSLSLSDMFIGIIFLFIIMLIAFSNHYAGVTGQLLSNEDTRKKILEDIKNSMGTQSVKVEIKAGAIFFWSEDKNTEWFKSGEYKLSDHGKQTLGILAKALHEILPCYSHGPNGVPTQNCGEATQKYPGRIEGVFIEGHTDSDNIRSPTIPDNWHLSAMRAIETYKTIKGHIGKLDEFSNDSGKKLFGVSGYGEFRPMAANDTEQNKARNRRIELRIIMTPPQKESE